MVAYYDLVVLLNARSVLSLLGIVLIVTCTWLWERKWESFGRENVLEPGEEEGYENIEKQDADGAAAQKDGNCNEVLNDERVAEMKDYFKFPKAKGTKVQPWIQPAFVGYVLIAFSYLCPRKYWVGFDFSWLSFGSMLLVCCLGYVQAVVIPKLIVQKRFTKRSDLWNMLTVFGFFVQGIFAFLLDTHAPVFAAPMGGLCIAISPMLLWRSRLVGVTYDSEGRVNPNPVLYNFGGPLLVFGWFWFWIGMNSCFYYPADWMPYIHVYAGTRMFMAFLGAVFTTCVIWFIGYALDEVQNLSGKPESAEQLQEASAFGMSGYFCGQMYEIKVATILSWVPFGLAMFFPYMWGDPSDWIFLAATIGMGYCTAMIQEEGLRMFKLQMVQKWTKRSWFMLAIMAIIIPVQQGGHYLSIILSLAGVIAYVYGQKYLLQDQKRNTTWSETHEVQAPNVYSFGAILTPLGLVLLAYAVSMHPR